MKVIVLCLGLIALVAAGGLKSATKPAVKGVANPLLKGAGKGVAGAAGGTQETANLIGNAILTAINTIGKATANAGKGVGAAVANTGNAAQSTVSKVQSNSGLAGDAVRAVGGN